MQRESGEHLGRRPIVKKLIKHSPFQRSVPTIETRRNSPGEFRDVAQKRRRKKRRMLAAKRKTAREFGKSISSRNWSLPDDLRKRKWTPGGLGGASKRKLRADNTGVTCQSRLTSEEVDRVLHISLRCTFTEKFRFRWSGPYRQASRRKSDPTRHVRSLFSLRIHGVCTLGIADHRTVPRRTELPI